MTRPVATRNALRDRVNRRARQFFDGDRAVFRILRYLHLDWCACSADPYCRCSSVAALPVVVPRSLRANRSPIPVATLRRSRP